MKNQDPVRRIYKSIFGFDLDDRKLNKVVKAVVIDFHGKSITCENDNYDTRRVHLDFTEGRKKAGLHPLQIVFSGVEVEAMTNGKFIGPDDQIHFFSELL